ncbi:T9SS type A sorting domain-containing protein [Hymenobacter terricola]|uniref:T9SS type A sorting domain-containing protein n=1 Tax=Hymenobacter terricola TaxID=2819236 RepID=UPI001B309AC2|nr:T9SS type A sorting domain-containing protein [Hymenobacter terricola]
MKRMFTLAAASVLAAGSLNAQAQVTLDGQLTAAEVTAGNYTLIGKFTNPRGFGNAGLLSLYAASTPTKMYIFVGGTVEANGNAFQLFLDLPVVAGVPVGTALPAGAATTSFQNFTAKLDLAADLALALRSEATGYMVEGAAYPTATTGSSAKLTTTAGQLDNAGTPLTLPATTTVGNYARLLGARVAYKVMAPGGVSANPGNTATTAGTPPVTTFPASYGGVGSYGWEIELDRTAAGLTGTPSVSLFALQNGGDGGYPSSDFIPQTSVPLTTNGGNLANGAFDFSTLPGRQAATVALGATGGAVLGTKAADAAAIAVGVFPNPASGVTTVAYNVGSHADNVNIVLTDLLGRQVQVLESGLKAAGLQSKTISTANVAAGTYLVRVQVGDKVATSKVVVL